MGMRKKIIPAFSFTRLTDVQVDVSGETNEGFADDAVGNRLTQNGLEEEWTYNQHNKLLTFVSTEYHYDDNRNATQLLFEGTVMFSYSFS